MDIVTQIREWIEVNESSLEDALDHFDVADEDRDAIIAEVKADGEDSATMDPVTPPGGKVKDRKGDKKGHKEGADKKPNDVTAKTSGPKFTPRPADKTARESVEEIFTGDELSEEFIDRASTVFEAAVAERVNASLEDVSEQFEQQLEEQVTEAVEAMTEKVDKYLSYVVEQWMEENTLAVENGLKLETAEALISDMRAVFEKHNLNIDEDTVSVVDDMQEQIDGLTDQLNAALEENIELGALVDTARREEIFDGIAEGLSATQTERLRSLVEGIDYSSHDEYREKVMVIKDNYFKTKVKVTEDLDEVDPDNAGEDLNEVTDPTIDTYAASIEKTFRNFR